MRYILALIAVAAPAAALADPVSLRCDIERSSGPITFALYEHEGKAIIQSVMATTEGKAMFAPEMVTIIASTTNISEIRSLNGQPTVHMGKCAVYEPPRRAF